MDYKAEILEGYKAFKALPDVTLANNYSCNWVIARIISCPSFRDEAAVSCMLDDLVGRYSVEVLGLESPTSDPLSHICWRAHITPAYQEHKPVETADLVEKRRAYVEWVINELS